MTFDRLTHARAILGATSIAALAALAAPAFAQTASDPIRLTLHDWTGQLITTQLMGSVLQEAGFAVEYVQADYLAQFAGLETGDLHVAMEIWETTGREAMDAAVATGNVEVLGPTGMQAKEEWWYPAYMAELCPGLPNWEALLDPACAEAFSTAETAPDGRYLGGPVTWGGFDEERIEALDLPFEVIHAGTDAALFAELEARSSARRRSCSGSMHRIGRRPNTKGNGSSSRPMRPNAIPIPPGAGTRTKPMTAASPSAISGRSPGPVLTIPGPAHKAIEAFSIDNTRWGR
jgi:hypothetical protein